MGPDKGILAFGCITCPPQVYPDRPPRCVSNLPEKHILLQQTLSVVIWAKFRHLRRAVMGLLKIEGVTHWSIPVNNLEESEKFYGDLLGLKPLGRLGNSVMSCFNVGDHNILLCEREKPQTESDVEQRAHHSFTV